MTFRKIKNGSKIKILIEIEATVSGDDEIDFAKVETLVETLYDKLPGCLDAWWLKTN